MKQQLKNKIVSAILAYPPETMTEAETQAEDIYRAVLKALETPTPEMIEAGRSIAFRTKFESYHDQAATIYHTMIRAAAGERGS